MSNVYLIGSYTSRFQKLAALGFKDLVREAYLGVLADAGLDHGNDIDFAWFGSCFMHYWGQDLIRGQASFSRLLREGLFPRHVPLINVEGACATGSMAFHGAWKDILSGQSELTLALGVEKLYDPDNPGGMMKAFNGGFDVFDRPVWEEDYRKAAHYAGIDYTPGGDRPVTMDTYGIQAAYHMKRYGTTQEQIAYAASKNHYHGSLNPKAQYQRPMSVAEVLADRPVVFPLTRAMCAPMSDGASAALLCSEKFLEAQPRKVRDRALLIRASVFGGGGYRAPHEPSLTKPAAAKAYAAAGVTPADIDLVEVHDATSFCEIYQAEMLGLCPEGDGGRFVGSGATKLGGEVPVNTSGGLVSRGHPLAATGLAMINELAVQLRHEAGARQVANATLGLQQNGGGTLGLEEAACSIVILERRA